MPEIRLIIKTPARLIERLGNGSFVGSSEIELSLTLVSDRSSQYDRLSIKYTDDLGDRELSIAIEDIKFAIDNLESFAKS